MREDSFKVHLSQGPDLVALITGHDSYRFVSINGIDAEFYNSEATIYNSPKNSVTCTIQPGNTPETNGQLLVTVRYTEGNPDPSFYRAIKKELEIFDLSDSLKYLNEP